MFREEGNEKYKNRDYEASAGEYTRALMYLDYTFGESEEQSDLVDIERFKCHLNLAAVYLELGLHRKAVNEGRIAISLNSKSCKAYYRRGVAHLRLGELDEAQKDLYYAMKLARESAMNDFSGIEDAIRELNVKWRKYRNDSVMISKAAIR
jgi:tetratricopeptide (TPR) repeat protein